MEYTKQIIEFLDKLESKKISYRLNKVRENTLMVEIFIPGQRWEIEFNTYGDADKIDIEIEKFYSDGIIYNAEELSNLFENYSN